MFPSRSYQLELLDGDNIPQEDLYQNLRELDFINTWLGGHDITKAGLKKILQASHLKGKKITVADVGCGGGDNLKFLAKWARQQKLTIQFVGIDLKADCIRFATQNCLDYPEIRFVQSDYALVNETFDIILSALFCHHLNDRQMVQYLDWCQKHSRLGFFINDLQRHPLAYFSIKCLTKVFSHSYLVKNDAPLSVQRGFHKAELLVFCSQAGILQVHIFWKWAFRYLIVYQHGSPKK
jgi:2-polyprenyl-3-methyl-5-hydroxy-6-metoxy-1,4-benzoquinol methylase